MSLLSTLDSTDARAARRRAEERRRQTERILELAEHLPDRDRLLLEQVYRHGQSMADLARLCRRPPHQVRRAVARLVRRLRQPLFVFLAVHQELLPAPVRRTACLCVQQGCSLRMAARISGQSLHQVRCHMTALAALARL